jgi:hypothetical protein
VTSIIVLTAGQLHDVTSSASAISAQDYPLPSCVILFPADSIIFIPGGNGMSRAVPVVKLLISDVDISIPNV